MQVKVFAPTTDLTPTFWHFAPALAAAVAGVGMERAIIGASSARQIMRAFMLVSVEMAIEMVKRFGKLNLPLCFALFRSSLLICVWDA
jgi:hypothetical protein